MTNNDVIYATPSWAKIPAEPTVDDMMLCLDDVQKEYDEQEEALQVYLTEPTAKHFAEFADETADCIVANWTLLNLMSQMAECPSERFAELTMKFTNIKNKHRGYQNNDETDRFINRER